jgi:glycosyltransferase involved in cell wall biosynthesis
MLSIVTGTLNRKHLLESMISNTVDSHEDLELVLVDGGSSDGTEEFIAKLNHPRIVWIPVGCRSSYPHFMNLGIKNSTHELVCQWNDDVLLCNEWEEVFNELDDSDAYLFNWKYGILEDIKSEQFLYTFSDNPKSYGWCITNTKYGLGVNDGEIVMNYGIYKKQVFRDIGMYDSKFNYYYADGDMAQRCWHFDKKIKTLGHIKVLALNEDKTAIHHGDDVSKYYGNMETYVQKTIPDTVEFLT